MRRLNNKGEVEGIALVLLLVAGLWFFISLRSYDREFNLWTDDCSKANGSVRPVEGGRYECFVDNKKVILKGWESYQ